MTEFEVQGMSCQHCVAAVTRSIQEIDPQAQVASIWSAAGSPSNRRNRPMR